MAEQSSTNRWQTTAVSANAKFLEERWNAITQQWHEATAVYRELYNAEIPDVAQLRRASRRLYELEQQRAVLKHALSA